jgi:hypothetical protein
MRRLGEREIKDYGFVTRSRHVSHEIPTVYPFWFRFSNPAEQIRAPSASKFNRAYGVDKTVVSKKMLLRSQLNAVFIDDLKFIINKV